jgi:hypothetical protein
MKVQEYKQGDVVVLAHEFGGLPKGTKLQICRKVAGLDRYVVEAPGAGFAGYLRREDGTAFIDGKFFERPLDPEKVRRAAAAIMVAKVGGPEWLGEPAEKFVARNEKFESPMWVEAYELAKIALEAAR